MRRTKRSTFSFPFPFTRPRSVVPAVVAFHGWDIVHVIAVVVMGTAMMVDMTVPIAVITIVVPVPAASIPFVFVTVPTASAIAVTIAITATTTVATRLFFITLTVFSLVPIGLVIVIIIIVIIITTAILMTIPVHIVVTVIMAITAPFTTVFLVQASVLFLHALVVALLIVDDAAWTTAVVLGTVLCHGGNQWCVDWDRDRDRNGYRWMD